MSRILVTSDDAQTVVDVAIDDIEGYATADCRGCPWTTDPDRTDGLRDVVEEAGIHLDLKH